MCPFRKLHNDAVTHTFNKYNTQKHWKQLTCNISKSIIIPTFNITNVFSFMNFDSNIALLQNHILLIFKTYKCKSKKTREDEGHS